MFTINQLKNRKTALIGILLLIFFSLSLGSIYRHLLAIIGVVGLVMFFRSPFRFVKLSQFSELARLFLCLWIPMLIALLDSDYLAHSALPTFRYIMYFFSGILFFYFSKDKELANRLLYGVFAILMFWMVDGLFQMITGINFFGAETAYSKRLTGMFTGVRLGLMLAIFSPLFFEVVRRLSDRYRFSWLLILPYFTIILFGGSRTSWILLVVAMGLFLIYFFHLNKTISLKRIGFRFLIVCGFVVLVISNVSWIEDRFVKVADLFSGDFQKANDAVSYRLPLWETSLNIIKAHPVNGVGVRSYGKVYEKFRPDYDKTIFGQPHLYVLEVASETGFIGLFGYLLFNYFLLRKLWVLAKNKQYLPIPWGLTACVAIFPLSAALSFYAHFMSAVIWMMLIIFFIACRESEKGGAEQA